MLFKCCDFWILLNIARDNFVCGNSAYDFICTPTSSSSASGNTFNTHEGYSWLENQKRSCPSQGILRRLLGIFTSRKLPDHSPKENADSIRNYFR